MPLQYCLLIVLACFATNIAEAQQPADSAFLGMAVANAKQLHKKEVGENLGLYNGVLYDRNYTTQTGHPYFLYNGSQEGSIVYSGTRYEKLPLLYDLTVDAVLTESYDHLHNIQLVPKKIDRFNIGDHEFIRLRPADTSDARLREGFYEILHNGRMVALAKHVKEFSQVAKGITLQTSFKPFNYYYILSGDQYIAINSKKSLLSVFGKQKALVNTYLRNNHLDFKKDPERTIINACKYYEQLIH